MKTMRKVVLAVISLGIGLLFTSQSFAYPICHFLPGQHATVKVSDSFDKYPTSLWPTTLVFSSVVPKGNGVYKLHGYTVRDGVAYPMYKSYCIEKGYGFRTPWKLVINSRDVFLKAHGVTDWTYPDREVHAMVARLLGHYKW